MSVRTREATPLVDSEQLSEGEQAVDRAGVEADIGFFVRNMHLLHHLR